MSKFEDKYFNLNKNCGVGVVSELSKAQVHCMGSVLFELRKLLNEKCDSHALLRCVMQSKEVDDVSYIMLTFKAFDIHGSDVNVEFAVDVLTKTVNSVGGRKQVKFGKGISEDVISNAVYDTLIELTKKVPQAIEVIEFPVDGKIISGTLQKHNVEDAYILVLYGDTSYKDSSYED